jgi:hypothetical protein
MTTKDKLPTSRQDAYRVGATRFLGKVCDKHPEWKGERMTSNNECVGCKKARHKAWLSKRRQGVGGNATTTIPTMTRVEARSRGETHYFGKVCDKHPELKGKRIVYNTKCAGCFGEKTKQRSKRRYARLKAAKAQEAQ